MMLIQNRGHFRCHWCLLKVDICLTSGVSISFAYASELALNKTSDVYPNDFNLHSVGEEKHLSLSRLCESIKSDFYSFSFRS